VPLRREPEPGLQQEQLPPVRERLARRPEEQPVLLPEQAHAYRPDRSSAV